MKLQTKILTLAIMAMALFTACSSDEPKEKDYKFPPLEEMIGDDVWGPDRESYFVASNGEKINMDDMCHVWVGDFSAPVFYISDNAIFIYNSCDGEGNTTISISNYRFDRMTGSIYSFNWSEPFMEIVAYDENTKTIEVRNIKGMVPMKFLTGHENEEGRDEESYMHSFLKPITDIDKLNYIRNPDATYDFRK